YYLQKTMIPIGHLQKPLLEYIIRLLKFHCLSDITLLVNYKAEQIQNYFGDGARFDVKVSYVHDSQSLKGTGGSVYNAYTQGAFGEKNTVLVYYGDILTSMNLKDLLNLHRDKKAAATVALASGFEVRVGVADLGEEGKIKGFIEKPRLEKPVSIGILAFEGAALKKVGELAERRQTVDLMGDIIPHLIGQSMPVYGFLSHAFWYDVGSIEAYEKLDNNEVKNATSFLF
ncbi:MAG: nucleotidyltransferase family protein, partial [Candidatus Bathyarchaeia archaeon]